jgi:fatty acid desaturase
VVWILNGLRLLVAAFLYLLAIPTLAFWHGNASVRRHIAQEYLGLLILATPIALWVPGDVLLWTWLVPMVIVALITQVRAFAQHTLTDPTDPLLAARSMRPWRVVSFVMLHENYHLEHHLFPRIPSYNLPTLSRLIESRLPKVVVGSSYLALIFRYLRASLTLNETPVVIRENASASPDPAADNGTLA